MTKSFYTLFTFIFLSISLNAQVKSIVDDLNTSKAGEGKITIYQDESIKNLIGASIQSSGLGQITADGSSVDSANPKNFVRTKGFRIQAYSGSDQKKAKKEAQDRKNQIASSFPQQEVNITYNSPVWRVKVGNFKTREEASQVLSEMKSNFPSFGREMYIVNDIIKVPID